MLAHLFKEIIKPTYSGRMMDEDGNREQEQLRYAAVPALSTHHDPHSNEPHPPPSSANSISNGSSGGT